MKKTFFLSLLIMVFILVPLIASCSNTATTTTAAPVKTPTAAPASTSKPAATTASTTAAADTEVIKLKYSSPFGEKDEPTVLAYELMDYVEQNSNGRVQFERYPAGILGTVPEQLQLVKTGSVDLASIIPISSAEIPLSHFPIWVAGDAAAGVAATVKIMWENSETAKLIQDEWTANNVKLLFANAGSFSGTLVKFDCSTLDELKGKKIGLGQPPAKSAFSEKGVIEVSMNPPEMYEAMSRGLVDGVNNAISSLITLDLYELGKCVLVVRGWNIPQGLPATINLEVFNKLPADIQQLILDAAEKVKADSLAKADADLASDIKKLQDAGVTVKDMAPEDLALWLDLGYEGQEQTFINDSTKAGKLDQANIILNYSKQLRDQEKAALLK